MKLSSSSTHSTSPDYVHLCPHSHPLPTHLHNPTPLLFQPARLQRRTSIPNQHFKICLIPLPRLRTRFKTLTLPTKAIIPIRTRITRPITLTPRFDPHKCIHKRAPGGARRSAPEARSVNVAPVAPFLAEPRDAVAARVDDGLGRHTCGFQLWGKELNVLFLVLRFVPLRVGCGGEFAGGQVPCVPARDVGGDAADLFGAAGLFIDGC